MCFDTINGSWPRLILVAKSIFTLALQRIQVQNEHHFGLRHQYQE